MVVEEKYDGSPTTINADPLRICSCNQVMQSALNPPPSLPTSSDSSILEVKSTGTLGIEEGSAVLDVEQASTCLSQ
jgi:hypothetical protein